MRPLPQHAYSRARNTPSLVMLFWFSYIFIHCVHFNVNNLLVRTSAFVTLHTFSLSWSFDNSRDNHPSNLCSSFVHLLLGAATFAITTIFTAITKQANKAMGNQYHGDTNLQFTIYNCISRTILWIFMVDAIIFIRSIGIIRYIFLLRFKCKSMHKLYEDKFFHLRNSYCNRNEERFKWVNKNQNKLIEMSIRRHSHFPDTFNENSRIFFLTRTGFENRFLLLLSFENRETYVSSSICPFS